MNILKKLCITIKVKWKWKKFNHIIIKIFYYNIMSFNVNHNSMNIRRKNATTTDFMTVDGNPLNFKKQVKLDKDLDMNSNKIINVATPTANTDVASKSYVDSLLLNLKLKEPVIAKTNVSLNANSSISGIYTYSAGVITATLSVSNVFTVDSVNFSSTNNGDRVLISNEGNSEDGIYTIDIDGTSLTLTRATDFDEDAETTQGSFWLIVKGTINGGSSYFLNNDVVIDTDTPDFVIWSSPTNNVIRNVLTDNNIAAGSGVLDNLTSGANITVMGNSSARSHATGDLCSIFGAKNYETGKSISYVNIFGTSSGGSMDNATNNNIFGHNSGNAIVTSSGNNIFGNSTGNAVTGSDNILIGNSTATALTGSDNIVIGPASGTSLVGNNNVVIVGKNSGINCTNNTNTIVGNNAGNGLGNSFNNVVVGSAFNLNTSGTATQSFNFSNVVAIGDDCRIDASNETVLSKSGNTFYAPSAVNIRSDARDKIDVIDLDNTYSVDIIKKLKPKRFRYNYRELYQTVNEDGSVTFADPATLTHAGIRTHLGFIAQDVKELIETNQIPDLSFYKDRNRDGHSLALSLTELISPLVKTAQVLLQKVELLEQKVEALENS